MTCADVTQRGLVEAYLLGRLTEEDRDRFEAHLFECEGCAEELKTLRSLQSELVRQRAAILAEPLATRTVRYWIPAVGLAAAALLAIAVWLRPTQPTPSAVTTSTAPAPSSAAPAAPSRESLMLLARVDPPRYVPLTLRSADTPTAFDTAMEAYAAKKFDEAVIGLRRAVTSDPNDVQANFYLAVSLLMTDDGVGAIDRLQAVLAAGDSPFRQTAAILLAKARIRTGDLDGAERELERAGANDLLAQLRAVRAGRGDARPRD